MLKGATTSDRHRTAIHEAGHAVASYFRREAGATLCVSIDADDLAQHNAGRPEKEHAHGFHSRRRTLPVITAAGVDWAQLRAALVVLVAGEEAVWISSGQPPISWGGLFLEEPAPDGTTGARGDVQEALRLLRATADTRRDELLRDAALRVGEVSNEELVREAADALIEEQAEMLERAQTEARELLREHWAAVEAVAEALLERGRLEADELQELIEAAKAAEEYV